MKQKRTRIRFNLQHWEPPRPDFLNPSIRVPGYWQSRFWYGTLKRAQKDRLYFCNNRRNLPSTPLTLRHWRIVRVTETVVIPRAIK